MKSINYLLLLLACICSSVIYTKNIILDLGGVVFKTNKFAAAKQIGMHHFAFYAVWHLKNPKKIQSIMFKTMERIAPWPKNFTGEKPTDDYGNEVPYLMYCWLTGKMSCQKIKDMLIPTINLHLDWFANKTEQTLVKNTVAMIFTPQNFITTQYIDPNAYDFIVACKKKGHKVYVLSNWDRESFSVLKHSHKELFNLCDGIVISGNSGNAKPEIAIYKNLLHTYNLRANDCFFIDDQPVNIVAAKSCGISGMIYNGKSLLHDNYVQKIIA